MYLNLTYLFPGIYASSNSTLVNVSDNVHQWLSLGLVPPKTVLFNILHVSASLQWTAVVLLTLIIVVSLRILLTRKKFKKELRQLSELDKEA